MNRSLSIILGSNLGAPARHGLATFEAALRARGWLVESVASAERAHGDVLAIAALGLPSEQPGASLTQRLDVPEALAVKKFTLAGKPAIRFAGADDRGLMYALLDAAESVAAAELDGEWAALREVQEQPAILDRALSIYTMNRAYWESRFYDERYWGRYFDQLASNRFLLIFGYENGGFLAPPYPYFFDTPGK